MSWSSFLRAHWGAFAATDFTVAVVSLAGLVRYYALFAIGLGSRPAVEVAAVVHEPDAAWMKQTARNLTDRADGYLLGERYLIIGPRRVVHRRVPGGSRRRRNQAREVAATQPEPERFFCESLVLSVRDECLSKVIPLGEHHLREVIREYVAHYHAERYHQGLANSLIDVPAWSAAGAAQHDSSSSPTPSLPSTRIVSAYAQLFDRRRWISRPTVEWLGPHFVQAVPACPLANRRSRLDEFTLDALAKVQCSKQAVVDRTAAFYRAVDLSKSC